MSATRSSSSGSLLRTLPTSFPLPTRRSRPKKIRLWNKTDAIDKAMRQLGLYERDNRLLGQNLAVNLVGAPAPPEVQAKRVALVVLNNFLPRINMFAPNVVVITAHPKNMLRMAGAREILVTRRNGRSTVQGTT